MNNFNAILIGLVVLAMAVWVADNIIGTRGPGTPSPMEAQAIAERIRPLGQIKIAAEPSVSTPSPVAVATMPAPITPAATIPPPAPPQTTESKAETSTKPSDTPAPVSAPAPVSPPPLAASPVEAPPSETPIATANLEEGKKIYITSCFACHETGAAGAPKRGDRAVWQPRLSQGMETLIAHVLNGFNAMPPRGGNPDLTEMDIATVIPYLVLDTDANQ
ncbi:hypothetical protein CCP3SC15_230002 [Gammaproteobacteria bacterium]